MWNAVKNFAVPVFATLAAIRSAPAPANRRTST